MKVLRSILAILLCSSMISSAVPSKATVHYCGGELMDITFNEKVEACCPTELNASTELQFKQVSCEFDHHFFKNYDTGATTASAQIAPVVVFLTISPFSLSLPLNTHIKLGAIRINGPPPPTVSKVILLERFLL